MKKALLVALCALGLTSVASADYQVVYHDYDQVLGVGAEGIALNNACVTDTEVKSIAPVKVCTSLKEVIVNPGLKGEDGQYSEWVCESYATRTLSASRAFQRDVCLKYDRASEASTGCLEFGKQNDFLPDTIKTSIVTVTNNESSSNFPGVSSTHTFPRCK